MTTDLATAILAIAATLIVVVVVSGGISANAAATPRMRLLALPHGFTIALELYAGVAAAAWSAFAGEEGTGEEGRSLNAKR